MPLNRLNDKTQCCKGHNGICTLIVHGHGWGWVASAPVAVMVTFTTADMAGYMSVQNIWEVNIWEEIKKKEKWKHFMGLCWGLDLINLSKSIFATWGARIGCGSLIWPWAKVLHQNWVGKNLINGLTFPHIPPAHTFFCLRVKRETFVHIIHKETLRL